jgi:hypothetical protein
MMLAKAGSEHARQDTDFNRQKQMVSAFLGAVAAGEEQDRTISVLARSADSLPAQVVVAMADELAGAGVTLRIILAGMEPEDALRDFASVLRRLNGANFADSLRWAKNSSLLDAHESASFGSTRCWVGDALRRDPSRRNALSIFSTGDADKARLAALGFTALWHASEAVAARRLSGALSPNASARYEFNSAEEAVEPPVMAPVLQPWPLIRH